MKILNTREMLNEAKKNGYAVPAINRAFMGGIRREMEENYAAYSFACLSNAGKYVENQIERIVRICGCEGRG